ncbi:unnamed protein product, partial [Rotaria sp. Silwood2]
MNYSNKVLNYIKAKVPQVSDCDTAVLDFEDLLDYVKLMRNSSVRSVRVALAIFLCKMRLGVANSVLSAIFQLNDKRIVSQIIHSVQKALIQSFVPQHIGFGHIDRQTVINQHSSTIATTLLTNSKNNVVVVIDGTYLYVQKSSDNEFQRRSYSLHKYRNLVK